MVNELAGTVSWNRDPETTATITLIAQTLYSHEDEVALPKNVFLPKSMSAVRDTAFRRQVSVGLSVSMVVACQTLLTPFLTVHCFITSVPNLSL